MSLILAIETSTKVCSVALFLENQLLGHSDFFIDKSHATLLTSSITNLIANCEKQMGDLSAIAVSQGPGSYTGLRIGLATAKGLCYALTIPLIAINTLTAMTVGVKEYFPNSSYLFCPMIDARRTEVYCAIYSENLTEVEPTQAKVIQAESFQNILQRTKVVFFGNGALKSKFIIAGNKNAIFLPGVLPSAKYVGEIANSRYKENKFEEVETFEPFYLKEFVLGNKGQNKN